ncbi:MAG: TonB-dependent receptor [Paludibacter sp.]|nr:TonB-dependent receptor [Paludibacter sp.]
MLFCLNIQPSLAVSIHTLNIKGLVVEQPANKPLPFATVRLLHAKDSSLFKGVSTDNNGNFELLRVNPGKYILVVSSIGYKNTYQLLLVNDKSSVLDLGKINIDENVIALREAVVTAQLTEMVVKGDTVEFNTEAFKLPESAVVEDLLKRLPGVEVSETGKITVQGKEIKKIMVNGKNFFKGDATISSKNIPVEIMDKLQIINEKSELAQLTGIDDGEDEIIINITIKKGMKQGVMLNANGGIGSELDATLFDEVRYDLNTVAMRFKDESQFGFVVNGNNINNQKFSTRAEQTSLLTTRKAINPGINTTFSTGVNYAAEKSPNLKMTGDITYGFSNKDISRWSARQNMLIDSVTFLKDTTHTINRSHEIQFNYQLEYKPAGGWTIQFAPSGTFSKSVAESKGFGVLSAADSTKINRSYKMNADTKEAISVGGLLTVVKDFDKKGRKLSFNIDSRYADTDGQGENFSRFFIYKTGKERERIDQQVKTSNSTMNTRFYSAYVEPIGKNNFFQTTYWFRYNDRESIKNSYVKDDQDAYTVIDPKYSKSLDNITITQQLALSFRAVRDKYNYLLGIDINPSYTSSRRFIHGGSYDGSDSTVYVYPGLTVWNFAPNLSYTYNFSKISMLKIDYKARTESPTIFQLDPTDDITNPNNIRRGNPNLIPTFVNTLRMRYSDFDKKNQRSFITTFSGQYLYNDIISKTIFEEKEEHIGTGIRTTEYLNESGSWNIQGVMMFNQPVGSMFQINNYSQFNMRNDIGYSYMPRYGSEKNISTTTSLIQNIGVSFRKDIIFAQLKGNYTRSKTAHSIEGRESQLTSAYGFNFSTQLSLPDAWAFSTDLRYRGYAGFSEGYNKSETLWSFEVSKMFLGKAATIRLRVNDVLGQQLNIVRNVTNNFVEDQEYNTLSAYAMLYLVYRFNTLGKKGKQNKSDNKQSMGGKK